MTVFKGYMLLAKRNIKGIIVYYIYRDRCCNGNVKERKV